MKAVILAVGEGTRLKPITVSRPKPLIKINGKTILEHSISILRNLGITEIIIITNYREKDIQEYFQNGRKYGVKIQYKKQKKMNGTAYAVNTIESIIENNFILIYGDLLFSSKAIEKILNLDPGGLFNIVAKERISMCGVCPTTMMLSAALDLGAQKAEIIDYTNSGSVSGDYHQVVAYLSMAVY